MGTHTKTEEAESTSQKKPRPKILFVDDETPVLKAMTRFGRSCGWDLTPVESGVEGLAALESSDFDVVISDMRMPNMNGAEFLSEVKERAPTTVRVLLTGYSDITSLESAINDAKIFSYLSKPWDESMLCEVVDSALRFRSKELERIDKENRTRSQNKLLGKMALSLDQQVKDSSTDLEQALALLQYSYSKVEQNFFESLHILTQVLEWQEGCDSERMNFITTNCEKLARTIKLSDFEINNIKIAAMLHRLGTLSLPSNVRQKPLHALSIDEREQYDKHPEHGELALSSASSLQAVGKIIRHQREYINGEGLPDGLTADKIPLAAKILAIVIDFYDLYTGSMEKNLRGVNHATRYMKQWSGKKYDEGLLEVFLEQIDSFTHADESCIQVKPVNLVSGMTLAQDIVTENGMLLLRKGTLLTQCLIEKLSLQHIENIRVVET